MISESLHRTTVARQKLGQTVCRAQYIESKCLLSRVQQKILVKHINQCSSKGFAPTIAIVRNMAEEIAKKMPRKNWVSQFIKTHNDELDSGFLDTIDIARQKADNWWEYKLYFDKVLSILKYSNSSNF